MDESVINGGGFIGYEYKDITVNHSMENLYADGYEHFGWKLESRLSIPFVNTTSIKFKRDRKIRNKTELTRLQRQFDSCIKEIIDLEKSKAANASIVAFTVGIIGTAFLAAATFSYLGDLIVLCIVLAIPGFAGWILPYFLYSSTYVKRSAKIAPLIEGKYDEIYEVCERANRLLGS